VDEILMGMYRSGPLFSFQRTPLKPDIVTLSKALSYMSFPIGATLVRAEVYKKAETNALDFADKVKTRYVNQLGAHIALHCLRKMQIEQIPENVQKQARYLATHLEKLKTESNLIERIEMAGLYFGVHFRKPWWLRMFGPSWQFMYLLFLTKCWRQAGVFTFFDTRLMPPLYLSEKEADQFLSGAKRMMHLRPWQVLAAGFMNQSKLKGHKKGH
jgi:acetylornithine/succinyldiaminopimelate/putrescine aminotransferase